MKITIDRESIQCAEEIFKSLGTSIYELQLYTEGHPRFRSTAVHIDELVKEFFANNPRSKNLTFTIRRSQVEFRNIPLVRVGSKGERLIAALESFQCVGLQFKPTLELDEIEELIRTLVQRIRSTSGENDDPPSSSDPESGYRFLYVLPEGGALYVGNDEQGDGDFDDLAPGSGNLSTVVPEFLVSENALFSVANSYRAAMSNMAQGRTFDYENLRSTTDHVVSLFTEQDVATLPTPSQSYFDDYTFHHSINVCLLTTRAATLVIDDEELIRKISVAALLHDIGKSRVPAEILHKPDRLTAAEAQRLQCHASVGAEILLSLPDIDPLCVTVAFGHHLGPESFSYPQLHQSFGVNWVIELVAVVDAFETLTATRPYKGSLSAERAFQALLHMPSMRNRHHLIKLLYDSLGPYPVGSLVELNTSERGVVVGSNQEDPQRPIVRLLTDPEHHRLDDPEDVDLASGTDSEGRTQVERALLRHARDHDPVVDPAYPEPSQVLGAPLHDDQVLMEREG